MYFFSMHAGKHIHKHTQTSACNPSDILFLCSEKKCYCWKRLFENWRWAVKWKDCCCFFKVHILSGKQTQQQKSVAWYRYNMFQKILRSNCSSIFWSTNDSYSSLKERFFPSVLWIILDYIFICKYIVLRREKEEASLWYGVMSTWKWDGVETEGPRREELKLWRQMSKSKRCKYKGRLISSVPATI